MAEIGSVVFYIQIFEDCNGNVHDLIVACKGFDILLCSETLVSKYRHIAELSIPGFKWPILFKRNEINRAQRMAVYVRSGCSASHKAILECGCHEVQIIKVCGKNIIILISFLFIEILMLTIGFLIVF